MSEITPMALAVCAAAGLAAGLAWACLRPEAVVRHAGWVLVVVALLSLGAASALVRLDPPGLRLRIDPSPEPLLPAGDPAQDVYRDAVRDFGNDEVFVIAMEAPDVFTAANLERLRRVAQAISRLDGVRDVQSLVDVTSFRYEPEEDWIEVRPFVEDIPTEEAALAELRRRALGDPLYRRTLVAADGRAAALNVSFREMSDDAFIGSGLDGRIGEILAAESGAGVRFHVAGRPHVKTHVYHTMVRDLRLLIPLALLAMAAVLALTSGSLRGVALPLGSVGIAVLWTFGALALLDRPLTILTTLLGPNLIVVGSVYGVHVLARHREDAVLAGEPRAAALACLEHVRLPVMASGLTTAIGYGSLVFTDVPAVFEYGAFSVLGVACVTLLSLTAVPALLAFLPLPRGAASGRQRLGLTERLEPRIDAGLGRLARLSARRSGGLVALWSALSVLAALFVPRLVVDTDYLSFFRPESEVRRDFEAVNRLLSGAVPLFVVVEGAGPGAFREPEALRALETVQARIDQLPGVSHTRSLPDLLRVLNRAMEEDDPAAERVPPTRRHVAELLQMVPKAELSRLATVDQARANLVVRTGEVGSAAVLRLTDSLEDAVGDGVLGPTARAHVTGNAILLSRSADAIAWGQANSVGLAAITIFLLLTVLLRSPWLGLVAMVPNVVPVLLFFGLLGSGVAPLSLPTSLIASVALGIAIDDTVHYLVRYRQERLAGSDPERAVAVASLQIGRPMAISAVMLILGFLVVTLSGFATLQQFGLLSAITMAICLATDLMLLPALLVRLRI